MSMSSVEFIEKYVKVRSINGAPHAVVLDDLMSEFVSTLEQNKNVIGRYTRVFGKTTALVGFFVHQLAVKNEIVLGYKSPAWNRNMDFLKQIAYAYRCLPEAIQNRTSITENADYFKVGKSWVIGVDRNGKGAGWDYDLLVYDDYRDLRFADMFSPISKQTAIIGTFPKESEIGKKWMERSSTWKQLPSPEQCWKVEAILSLCDLPNLRMDY